MSAEFDTGIANDAMAIEAAESYRRRKQTSVLAIVFTDVANSTALRERLGEHRYEDLREDFESRFAAIITAQDAGSVVKGTGDGALSVFAEPSTAVERSLAVQRQLAAHPFKVRIGIDMGQVSVKSSFGIVADVFGRQVNRAARVESLAEPGHVLTSFNVYDCAVGWLKDGPVRWHNHGLHELKGFAEATSVHEAYDPRVVLPQDLRASRVVTLLSRAAVDVPKFSRKGFDARAVRLPRWRDPTHADWLVACREVRERALALSAPTHAGEIDHEELVQSIAFAVRCLEDRLKVRPRILLVDFDRAAQRTELKLLKACRGRLDIVYTSNKAREKITSARYILVIALGRSVRSAAQAVELSKETAGWEGAGPVVFYGSPNTVMSHADAARDAGSVASAAGMVSLLRLYRAIVEAFERSISRMTVVEHSDEAIAAPRRRGFIARLFSRAVNSDN